MYENVLMFGDFLLRMPEVTKKVCPLTKCSTYHMSVGVYSCSGSVQTPSKSGFIN